MKRKDNKDSVEKAFEDSWKPKGTMSSGLTSAPRIQLNKVTDSDYKVLKKEPSYKILNREDFFDHIIDDVTDDFNETTDISDVILDGYRGLRQQDDDFLCSLAKDMGDLDDLIEAGIVILL